MMNYFSIILLLTVMLQEVRYSPQNNTFKHLVAYVFRIEQF